MTSEGQRLQYLEAMGIQAWISREQAGTEATTEASVQASYQSIVQNLRESDLREQPEPGNPATASKWSGPQPGSQTSVRPARFEIGPGSGSTLLLCTQPADAATPLASDIARCLDEAPVWGWLTRNASEPGASDAGFSLERAIDERLFTRVILFGDHSAVTRVGKSEVLSSARIIYAPPIAELARDPAHKRTLWMQLLTHGWCTRRG